MAEAVEDFDFSDEFSKGLAVYVFLAEALDGHGRAEPLAFENVSVASRADGVDRRVELQLVEVNQVSEAAAQQRAHEL